MTLYPKAVLVALPSTAGPEALLSPVARFVRGVLVLPNENFTFGEMQSSPFLSDPKFISFHGIMSNFQQTRSDLHIHNSWRPIAAIRPTRSAERVLGWLESESNELT